MKKRRAKMIAAFASLATPSISQGALQRSAVLTNALPAWSAGRLGLGACAYVREVVIRTASAMRALVMIPVRGSMSAPVMVIAVFEPAFPVVKVDTFARSTDRRF